VPGICKGSPTGCPTPCLAAAIARRKFQGSAVEPDRAIETPRRILDAGDRAGAEPRQERVALRRVSHVDEDRRRARLLDRLPSRGDVADRLAAEGAAGMAEEDEEHRSLA